MSVVGNVTLFLKDMLGRANGYTGGISMCKWKTISVNGIDIFAHQLLKLPSKGVAEIVPPDVILSPPFAQSFASDFNLFKAISDNSTTYDILDKLGKKYYCELPSIDPIHHPCPTSLA
jgi:hypothetical protein